MTTETKKPVTLPQTLEQLAAAFERWNLDYHAGNCLTEEELSKLTAGQIAVQQAEAIATYHNQGDQA